MTGTFDPITELKLHLDNLKKSQARLEEDLADTIKMVDKYSRAIKVLEEDEIDIEIDEF